MVDGKNTKPIKTMSTPPIQGRKVSRNPNPSNPNFPNSTQANKPQAIMLTKDIRSDFTNIWRKDGSDIWAIVINAIFNICRCPKSTGSCVLSHVSVYNGIVI